MLHACLRGGLLWIISDSRSYISKMRISRDTLTLPLSAITQWRNATLSLSACPAARRAFGRCNQHSETGTSSWALFRCSIERDYSERHADCGLAAPSLLPSPHPAVPLALVSYCAAPAELCRASPSLAPSANAKASLILAVQCAHAPPQPLQRAHRYRATCRPVP